MIALILFIYFCAHINSDGCRDVDDAEMLRVVADELERMGQSSTTHVQLHGSLTLEILFTEMLSYSKVP